MHMRLFKSSVEDTAKFQVEHQSDRKGIMIVDDSRFTRNLLRDILKNEGYDIIGEAGDGIEAIEKAKELRPAVIFLDVEMPKLDGLGAIPRILEQDSGVNIIMCTAMGQKKILIESAKAGAKDYVIKPFKRENIISVLELVKYKKPESDTLTSDEVDTPQLEDRPLNETEQSTVNSRLEESVITNIQANNSNGNNEEILNNYSGDRLHNYNGEKLNINQGEFQIDTKTEEKYEENSCEILEAEFSLMENSQNEEINDLSIISESTPEEGNETSIIELADNTDNIDVINDITSVDHIDIVETDQIYSTDDIYEEHINTDNMNDLKSVDTAINQEIKDTLIVEAETILEGMEVIEDDVDIDKFNTEISELSEVTYESEYIERTRSPKKVKSIRVMAVMDESPLDDKVTENVEAINYLWNDRFALRHDNRENRKTIKSSKKDHICFGNMVQEGLYHIRDNQIENIMLIGMMYAYMTLENPLQNLLKKSPSMKRTPSSGKRMATYDLMKDKESIREVSITEILNKTSFGGAQSSIQSQKDSVLSSAIIDLVDSKNERKLTPIGIN